MYAAGRTEDAGVERARPRTRSRSVGPSPPWGMHTLQAFNLMIETVALMRPLAVAIDGHDRDLARQIRRAANSVALNLAEASGSDRGNRKARLHTALGSAKETLAGFRLAWAWGYVDDAEAERVSANLDRVARMIYGLLRR